MTHDEMQEVKLSVFDTQSKIISLQASVIDDLIDFISIHHAIDESCLETVKERIDEAAMLRNELDF